MISTILSIFICFLTAANCFNSLLVSTFQFLSLSFFFFRFLLIHLFLRLWNRTKPFVMSRSFVNTNGIQYIDNVNVVFCNQCGHYLKFNVAGMSTHTAFPFYLWKILIFSYQGKRLAVSQVQRLFLGSPGYIFIIILQK